MVASKIFKLFVGNKHTHIVYDDEVGTWKRSYTPISLSILLRHLRHKLAIGSYPIYRCGNKNCCKWICIDIDSHERIPSRYRKEVREEYDEKTAKYILKKLEKEYAKRTNEELKKKHFKIVKILYDESIKYLGIPNKYMITEDSVGGYHIWIFLKDNTLLEDVGKWVYTYRDNIYELYSEYIEEDDEMPEIYPKQFSLTHLNKKVGNGVRLPLGYNFGKQGASEILKGSIDEVEKYDLHELVKDIDLDVEKLNGFHCKRTKEEIYKEQDIPMDLDFWMEMPIRPCFKWIINGKTQCYGEHGHIMRMALVHECKYYKMPLDVIIKCFENQYDHDPIITRAQVESVINSSNIKDGRYSCYKIKQLGYCHKNCEYEKKSI